MFQRRDRLFALAERSLERSHVVALDGRPRGTLFLDGGAKLSRAPVIHHERSVGSRRRHAVDLHECHKTASRSGSTFFVRNRTTAPSCPTFSRKNSRPSTSKKSCQSPSGDTRAGEAPTAAAASAISPATSTAGADATVTGALDESAGSVLSEDGVQATSPHTVSNR